jgi:ubiquinone/menaquinone biosynthesis C-methylase UbiE
MQSSWLPLIYERLWRPVGFRVWVGADTEQERRITRELLGSKPGDAVLDVACGPGNTTRRLARDVGPDGLVVGLDAAAGMLAQGVRDTRDERLAFVRGDAEALPFEDQSFDGVACHGALYLIGDPFAALAEQVRVLKPGGRIALLTSCERGPAPLRALSWLATRPSGVRVFGPQEITDALAGHGLEDVRREIRGFAQLVGARKPGPTRRGRDDA